MKLIRLSKFTPDYENKESIYVNPLNITFIMSGRSCTFIYFGDINTSYIQVWESPDEINRLVEESK